MTQVEKLGISLMIIGFTACIALPTTVGGAFVVVGFGCFVFIIG